MNDKTPYAQPSENNEALFRGTLLVLAADIEAHLANIISSYFCGDREKQLILASEVLMTRNFGFSAKTDLMRVILLRHRIKENPEIKALMVDLKKVREFRNVVTHSSFILSRSGNKSGCDVVLTTLKNGNVNQSVIDPKEQEEWVELFRATHGSLLRLTPLLLNELPV